VDKTIAGQGFYRDGESSKRKCRLANSYRNESFATKSFADVALAMNWLAARKTRWMDCRDARFGPVFADDKSQKNKSDYEN